MMMDISRSGEVAATSSIGIGLRCASAAGLTLGSLLFGARIVPLIGKFLLSSVFLLIGNFTLSPCFCSTLRHQPWESPGDSQVLSSLIGKLTLAHVPSPPLGSGLGQSHSSNLSNPLAACLALPVSARQALV